MGKTYKHNQDQRDTAQQQKISKKAQGQAEKRFLHQLNSGV